MIVDKFPDLKKLPILDKLLLANELWEEVEGNQYEIHVDENMVALLDERFKEYKKNPESAVNWEDFNS